MISKSIRSQLTLGYTITLVIFVVIPILMFSVSGYAADRSHLVYLALLTLGAMLALFLAHLMLTRVLASLALFDQAQQAAQQDAFARIDTTTLPYELQQLAESYNGMVDRLEQRHSKLHDQQRRIALLSRLAIELRATFEPSEVINDTLTVIDAHTGVSGASIVLLGADGTVEAACAIRAGVCTPITPERVRTVLERGLGGWVVRHNRSVIISDVSGDSRWLPTESGRATRSVVALPLTHGKTVLGVLTITHAEREHFDSGDLLVLESVAAQTGLALSGALRQAEERRLREQAMLLFSMSQYLTAKRSERDLASKLLEQSADVFNAIHSELYLGSSNQQQLVLFVSHDSGELLTSEQRGHVTMLAERAFQNRATVIENLSGMTSEGQNRVCIALPLLHNDQAIGVFIAIRCGPHAAIFPARTWSLLTTFTNVAAAAFANVQLIDQLQQRAEQLEQIVHQRTRQLQHSRDMLRIVFDNLPDGLVLYDQTEHILTANAAFCSGVLHLHPRHVVGQTYGEISQYLKETTPRIIEELPSNQAARRVCCTEPDGQRHWYEIDQYTLGQLPEQQVIERWRNVTSQEELHRRLLLHEQLTSMGRLAASVVHEVGNPLQGVQGCLELCREDPTLPPALDEYLGLASSEIARINALLQRWRDLYRSPQAHWEAFNINDLVLAMCQITARQMEHAKVSVTFQPGNDVPLVCGQPDALRQVYLNLLLNAQEAMPDGGSIAITTLSDQHRRMSGFRICDTGVGMSPDQLQQVCEPFQSSHAEKPGLGLYLCKTIIEQHRGDLQLASTAAGTTATVWIPWSEVSEGNNSAG